MAIVSRAKLRAALIAALAISAMVLAGCGSASSSSSSTSAAAPAATSSTSASASTESSGSSGSSKESGPEELSTSKGSVGTYLTADEGRSVYLWVADSGGKSACSGSCAKYWPPVETKGKPKAEDGVNAALLGTITRSDGSEQVTYKGHPLYYYLLDKSKGETTGQGNDGFGAKWWLVAPSGQAITSGGSSASTSTSSSGYGSGG